MKDTQEHNVSIVKINQYLISQLISINKNDIHCYLFVVTRFDPF